MQHICPIGPNGRQDNVPNQSQLVANTATKNFPLVLGAELCNLCAEFHSFFFFLVFLDQSYTCRSDRVYLRWL